MPLTMHCSCVKTRFGYFKIKQVADIISRCYVSVTADSRQVQQPLNFLAGKRVDLNSTVSKEFDLIAPATG